MKILIYLDIKLKLCHRKEKSLKSIIKNIYIRETDRIRTHDPTITRMTLLLIPAPKFHGGRNQSQHYFTFNMNYRKLLQNIGRM